MACSIETERDELLQEVELLQAIYVHELELQGPVERPTSLTLFLHPSTGNDDHTLKYVCLNLCLTIPAKYPSVIPGISIQNPRGLSDAHIDSIQENLLQLAKEKTGSPILYDLIEYTKDCLSDNNIPSCPCVICLEHFQEEIFFVKTKCYHYFHSLCLGKYVDHFLCENEKVLCPMCRLEIDFDKTKHEAGYECGVSEEIFVYKPDKEQQKAQRERQRILQYQTQKGGIINIEEERNKYLIEIKGTKPECGGGGGGGNNAQMNSLCEKKVVEKKEGTLGKVGNEQRQSVEEHCKGREGVSRDKRGTEGWAGKSWVINRTYQNDPYGMDDSPKRREKNRKDNYHKEFRSNQRNSKNEGAERKHSGYQRRPERTASGMKHGDKQKQLEMPVDKQGLLVTAGGKQGQLGISGYKQEQVAPHGGKQEQLRTPAVKQEQLGTPGDKQEQLETLGDKQRQTGIPVDKQELGRHGDKQRQTGIPGDKQEQLGRPGDKQRQTGIPGDKQEQLGRPGKVERRGKFSSLEKRKEKFLEEKDLNRNTRSTHQHLGRIWSSKEYKDRSGIEKHSSPPQDIDLKLKKVISNNCSSKGEIKSERREVQCQDGTNSDPKIHPKTSRKRTPRPRKPRAGKDPKTSPKTLPSKVPSNTSDAESKVERKEVNLPTNKHEIPQEALKKRPKTSVTLAVEDKIEKPRNMNEQKLSKNVSNLQNATHRHVTATKLSPRRPPPGFESVTP